MLKSFEKMTLDAQQTLFLIASRRHDHGEDAEELSGDDGQS